MQTLNFKPFRVPLTPFAGVLSNGTIAHQIALSVYGANSYFSVTGALMLYLDHGGSQVTGSITQNTLAAPSSKLKNTITGSTRDLAVDGFQTRRVNFTFRYVPEEHIVPYASLPQRARADVKGYLEQLARHSPFFAAQLAEADQAVSRVS